MAKSNLVEEGLTSSLHITVGYQGNQDRNTRHRAQTEAMKKCCLLVLLMGCAAYFLIALRTSPGWYHPRWSGSSQSILNQKNALQVCQSGGSIFSTGFLFPNDSSVCYISIEISRRLGLGAVLSDFKGVTKFLSVTLMTCSISVKLETVLKLWHVFFLKKKTFKSMGALRDRDLRYHLTGTCPGLVASFKPGSSSLWRWPY